MANNDFFLEVTKAINSMIRDMESFCREEGDRLESRLAKQQQKDSADTAAKIAALEARIKKLEEAKAQVERLAFIAIGISLAAFGKSSIDWIKLLF